MNSALVALLLATTPAEATDDPHQQAVCEIAASCQNGSLIFSKGDCLAVRAYTNSPYTHVATVVYEDGQPVIYDSMNGTGVRKLPLEEYLDTQSPDEVHLFHPKREFTSDETARYQRYLDSQLGRPYSVKHHISGKRSTGVHCSEYVTDALAEIDWLKVENPPRVSPASLVEGISTHGVYSAGPTIALPVELEPVPMPDSRCSRMWMETKSCMARCCSKLSRWVLCR